MAVIHMLGADGITKGAYSTSNTGFDYLKGMGLHAFEHRGAEVPCLYIAGTGFSFASAFSWVNAFKLDNSSGSARMYYSIPVNDPVFDADRTGKWYIHNMMRCGGYGPTTVYAQFTYLDREGSPQSLSLSANFVNSPDTHIEVIIDWELKEATVYKYGTLMSTVEFSEITSRVDVGFCSRVATSTGGWSQMSNMYFVIDRADDPNPTGRLGACWVYAEPLSIYEPYGPTDPNTPETALPILNALDSTNPANGVGVLTSSNAKPFTVGVDHTKSVSGVAAQISVHAFKDPESLALMETQIEGDPSSQDIRDVPTTRHSLGPFFVFNKDKDGVPLIDSTVSNLPDLLVWSKR